LRCTASVENDVLAFFRASSAAGEVRRIIRSPTVTDREIQVKDSMVGSFSVKAAEDTARLLRVRPPTTAGHPDRDYY
jgi:hypothetical protein